MSATQRTSVSKVFIDSNVVLYLLSADHAKADRAEGILEKGGVTSVHVLNEITSVARRKLKLDWTDIDDLLATLRAVCTVEPLTLRTHDEGRRLARRYQLSVYDAMIVAAARVAGCDALLSEDMQHDLLIDKQLRVCNPFLRAT